MNKIAVFFGGKPSRHLGLIKRAAKKLGVELDLISYNRVSFDTETGKVRLNERNIDDYEVLFFRTTGKHRESVDLILDAVREKIINGEVKIVDPILKENKTSATLKAYQMLALKRAEVEVPKTVYGSLFYLRDEGIKKFSGFPLIIKGSGGNRGERVFKVKNKDELEELVLNLRTSEVHEGKRYLMQEYVENDGDFRVLVLGDEILGAMKRSRQNENEFRNNFSTGGKVEPVELPEEIKKLAVKAAKVCGVMVAGVDVVLRNGNWDEPLIWEVNKGPQFSGFAKATGMDVPYRMVKFLVSLMDKN
jgi:RimK family alpha-L-glutamate ligase